jgi:sugar phosphate isomerase/epimerase
MAELGFDFIDLTLEPPMAMAQRIDAKAVKSALADANLGVVGHTAFYLPICSPFESIRRASADELKHCLEVFAILGASWMNLHPDNTAPFYDRRFVIEKNLQTIREILPFAKDLGMGLMIENLPGGFNNRNQLAELLDPVPELGLHLDIGHANLQTAYNTSQELLASYGQRLRHVHLHDNKGGSADLHLPLGAGNLDARQQICALQAAGYDGTITLEVFTSDRQHLVYSRDVLRRLWDECAERRPVHVRG